MKRVWLIRHGHHDWIGRALVGRKPGISLNEEGRAQAQAIAELLRGEPLAAIYASPQARALQTAIPLARAKGLPVRMACGFDEVDFGEWTGRSFAELETDPRWQVWNASRASAQAPGGETMRAVQERVLQAVETLAGPMPIALFSHADVIRAALANYLHRDLNDLLSISFEPGAVAFVEWGPAHPVRVNLTPLQTVGV